METFLIKAAQLIAAFALLVIIHEFGHYIFARMFGIKVEKFYLFFDPWFSLFKYKPKKKSTKTDPNGEERATWRDTEYGIGWLPLGGYVKIAGMIDESMDKEQLAQEPKSWEFRSKPAYQRLLVMVAGVLMNFILAIIIYAGIAWYWGEKYIPLDKAYEGMDYAEAAQEIGFRNGDILLEADGRTLDSRERSVAFKMLEAREVTVLRNHRDTVAIRLPEGAILTIPENDPLMAIRVPVYVKQIMPGEPAAEAGLQVGDRIIAVGDSLTPAFTELSPALLAYKGKPTELTLLRGNDTITMAATPTSDGKLGFGLKTPLEVFSCDTTKYGFFQSVPVGVTNGTDMLVTYVGSLKHLFSKQGAESIGGFGAIGSMFPSKWDWRTFWEMTAFLSIMLAFMNLLPIPALDGGHVAFLLWEVITRRKPSDKFLERAQLAGMLFLIILLIYANFNDLYRFVLK